MAGPWEEFQQTGPWSEYQTKAPEGGPISDIIPEMANTLQTHLSNIKGMYGGTAANGPIQQTLNVGKGLASLAGVIPDTLIGAPARSILGHGMAAGEHAVGQLIAPEIAAKDNPQEMYQTAKGNVDTALSALAARGTKTVPAPPPSTEAINAAADSGFNALKKSGIEVPSKDVKTLATATRSALESDGFRDYLAPKTFSVLSELETPPKGSVANISDLHGIRRVLGKAAASADPTERAAASRVMSELDTYLSGVSPELKTAIANYSAAKHSETVQGKLDRADLNAASANSGANIDNATRQQIKSILMNPKARRGFTKEEIAQMEKIVRGTSTANLVRGTGNLLGGGGGLGAMVTGGAGYAAAGPAGVAAPAAGYAMKKLGNALTAREVAKLDSMIRARSPLALEAPPISVPIANPLLGGINVPNILQMLGVGLRPMPARADQNQ